ncbi:conserved hypothetical protein [Gammaproteobacteria bacterium]
MSEKLYTLEWNGDLVMQATEEQLMEIMPEFALIAEGEAKKELTKTGGTAKIRYVGGKKKTIFSHGKVTGTLQRSIHAASPDYSFGADNVEPSSGSPERGRKTIKAQKTEEGICVLLGSGLSYAMKIHQGWGSFKGYHYLTNGVESAKKKLPAIIERHPVRE